MNYKIGDKVNISLTAPLIVTDIDKHLDRIKVSSENGDIYFWASPKFFTPHTTDLTIDLIAPQLCNRPLVELHTQKLLINGQPARKILDIKNALPLDQLPPDYTDHANSSNYYYQYESTNGGHFEFNGIETGWVIAHNSIPTKNLHIIPTPTINISYYHFTFNQNSIWSEPDYQTILASLRACSPHTPPPTSPHKSLNIGDLIITKPTATPYHYEAAIGNHIGVIKNNAVNEDCYLVQWIYNISTHQKLEPSINAVHIDQFAHIYTPPPRPTTSKKCIPQLGDIVVAASGTCSKGYVNISNLVGCIIKEDRHGTTVEWIEPLYEEWPSNIVNPDDLTIIYRPP
jgi:hypothetical protein